MSKRLGLISACFALNCLHAKDSLMQGVLHPGALGAFGCAETLVASIGLLLQCCPRRAVQQNDSSLYFSQLIAKAHHRWQIMEATDSSDDITAVVINFKH